jgi:hypothetical protein
VSGKVQEDDGEKDQGNERMGLWATTWAFKLTDATPLAKLLVICLSDNCGDDGRGKHDIVDLAEWCCVGIEPLRKAIEELGDNHGVSWSIDGTARDFQLPEAARLPEKGSSEGFVDRSRHNLYVISCGEKTKVGISKSIKVRIATLQELSPIQMKVEWQRSGPAYLIRKIERHVQEALCNHRLQFSREWFSLSVPVVIATVEEVFAKMINTK